MNIVKREEHNMNGATSDASHICMRPWPADFPIRNYKAPPRTETSSLGSKIDAGWRVAGFCAADHGNFFGE